MRTPDLRSERGIALVVAVVALVVIGAIVAGTFFVSTLEQRSAQNVVVAAAAQQAAEAGLEDAIDDIKGGDYPFGLADSTAYKTNVTPSGWATTTSYTVWVFPVNSSTWLIKSIGTSNGATQTLGEVVKAAVTNTPATAPLIVSSPVTFNGNAFEINGNNANPPVATGCPSTPTPPQVYAVRSQTETGMNNGDRDNILGVTGTAPGTQAGEGSSVANDATVAPLMNTIFGTGGSYDQFRSAATLTYGPGTYTQREPVTVVVNGETKCDYADARNWGEPKTIVTQCQNYFPIVLGTSSFGNPFKISGNYGQGILLADGDLELSGGFEWYGLILVKGSFKITGTGAKVFGSVIAQNGATVDDNTLSGNTEIGYSTCAISRALNGVAPVRPAGTRAWTQLF
jgi:Tfp pilus assembly protein PilX